MASSFEVDARFDTMHSLLLPLFILFTTTSAEGEQQYTEIVTERLRTERTNHRQEMQV
eukprot:m.85695 g.85695  ORF g.85695 m.85695 type:complete len:58 (-) comp25891_c0_seq1:89-262(-)